MRAGDDIDTDQYLAGNGQQCADLIITIKKGEILMTNKYAVYAGNPGFFGFSICSTFIGIIKAKDIQQAYDIAHNLLRGSGYQDVIVNEVI